MIEQGLFKKYFVGRDGFYWWIGQIAPEAYGEIIKQEFLMRPMRILLVLVKV